MLVYFFPLIVLKLFYSQSAYPNQSYSAIMLNFLEKLPQCILRTNIKVNCCSLEPIMAQNLFAMKPCSSLFSHN